MVLNRVLFRYDASRGGKWVDRSGVVKTIIFHHSAYKTMLLKIIFRYMFKLILKPYNLIRYFQNAF
nr:MAG TPA: hypothetical protein [Caudoviricetes sp.]